MSDVDVIDAEVTEEELSPEMAEYEAFRAWVAEAFAMSPGEFLALTAKQQNSTIFVMLRDVGAQVRYISSTLTKWDAKIEEAASPEGLKKMKDAVMEELSGGLFKGLL